MKKQWYNYLWIVSILYLILGLVNILFAWLGLICFSIPLIFSIVGGTKTYCNKYCGRSQLLELLGQKYGLSKNILSPRLLRTKWFRYGFLIFFMLMFLFMLWNTYLVFRGASLNEAVTILWTFNLPWKWTNTSFVSTAIAQFAFGFYSIMLTSTILGIITMFIFRPRSWCVYCPIGTMTQAICQIKCKREESLD